MPSLFEELESQRKKLLAINMEFDQRVDELRTKFEDDMLACKSLPQYEAWQRKQLGK